MNGQIQTLRLERSRNCADCKHRLELVAGKLSCAMPEFRDERCGGEHYEWDGTSDYD